MEHSRHHHKELQLLPSSLILPPSDSSFLHFRSAALTSSSSSTEGTPPTPSLDLELSISLRPMPEYKDGGGSGGLSVEALKWESVEEIRLAAMEKAYAERVRELTRREIEMAQSEFARARHVWERARAELERAERMKERATRHIGSAACMEITCQSCRQRFWCSFGPENYGEGGGILPSRRYRLNTRNRAARPQSMRGCTCHFVVHKLGMIIKRSTHELDLDDQASIRMWIERNKKSVFFNQDASESNPFILGIQTEWQLQQMIRFGHHSIVAVDSTFGIKRLKYPLFTLLVFYSRNHALPVAWVITRSFAKHDVSEWLKSLIARARSVEPGWKVSGLLIDDAAADIDLLRDIFCCPILFSLWRIRISWLRNIVKKCCNIEVQREIFKRLGTIVYGIWGGDNTSIALEQLVMDFVDQTAFMEYFKASWVPKIEMWLSMMRSLPLASLEASGAIEAYHVKLKAKLFDDSHLGALQRVDWLVHKLTTELHSSYWLDRYADESDSFLNVKEEYIASTSWHRALQIPDSAVTLDDKDHLFARVVSQKDSTLRHLVWNPGSEFAFCDCSWSLQGNLCKHVIKVNMMCENNMGSQPSLSFISFKDVLMDLWTKPKDDSVALDLSMAWTHQMLDQIQKLVELNNSNDIGVVVKNMPLKWVSKKGRTYQGKRSLPLALPSSSNIAKTGVTRRKSRKRKRLSQIR